MPNPKMPNLVQSQEPAKKTSMEGAITTNCESSQASTPSSMKKKTTIFPRKRVLPMPKRKGRVAVAPAHAEVTISDEELLMVTKMIEEEELAKTMKKIQEDEAAQGGGRTTMVAENTMGVKPPPPKQNGAMPKLPTPVPSKRIMAVKPAAKELAQTLKKKNHQDDEVAQGGGRAAMVAENTMDVKPPPPRKTGARPKLPTTAPSQKIMAAKPANQQVGNDSSDEDILKAVLELEHLRLREAGAGGAVHGEHPQGDHHEANGQDEGVDGVLEVPDQTLSPRVLKSIPGRIQRCKEGEEGQEAHGQDHLPAGGGQHHGDDQEEGVDHDQEVERGVPDGPTSPPSPRMTPDKARPRVICTPLWKRKSQQRRSSSFQSKKNIKKTGSMLRSPTSSPTTPATAASIVSTTSQQKQSSTCPMPRMDTNIHPPLYAQPQSASTSRRTIEQAGNQANQRQDICAWR